jgi:toxin ParE1/3/4
MTVEVLWTPRAREDLVEIYMTIGVEQPDAAERYFDRIEEKARWLRDQPRRGPRRPDIRPGARMLVEAPYLILYETVLDTDDGPLEAVVIVRVVDGRRDLPSLF